MTSAVLTVVHPPASVPSDVPLAGPSPVIAPGAALDPVPVPVQARVVVRVPLTPEQVAEHPPQVGNVGLGLELEAAAVREVLRELAGTSLAQGGDGDGLLLLHDELVLLGGALGLEALPGEPALEEVDEDVADGLEVVAAGLLDAQVVVDGGVAGGAGEGPSLALGDVLEGAGVAVALRQAEVDAVDEVPRAAPVGDEVGRLDVAVDEVAAVHDLHALEHLIGDHEDGLEAEAASALVELVLEGGPEEVHDHEVVGVLGSEIVDLGEAGGVLELAVDLVFVAKLGAARAMLFEFHGHLLPVGADAEVDVTERAATDSLGDAVFGDGGLHFLYFFERRVIGGGCTTVEEPISRAEVQRRQRPARSVGWGA
ncbi:hypothetical protein ACHAWF_018693 [Thalassiosira exigua]